jgi:2-amino-4-hydroxy-6-hydroxymethyldihydropteridine diphosphokinase
VSGARLVYLALGSNVGDRLLNLRAALRRLAASVGLAAVAPLYQTPPAGVLDQPPFLNSACAVETDLPPLALLRLVKGIEWEMGRRPAQVWGPRPLDIDILLDGETVLAGPPLDLPHPRFHTRGFQTIPLADIAPGAWHPLLGRTVAELRDALPEEERGSLQRVAGPEWAHG